MKNMKLKLVFIGAIFLVSLGFPGRGVARVSIDIQVGPPPLVISGPPEVVVIPGTYVYFVPGIETDLFFYGGYWFRPHEERWFRSENYNGPWIYIARENVLDVLFHLPRDYRAMSGYRHIPYRNLSRNWRTWEREKYWERHGWGRHDLDREREHGVAPSFRERERHDFDRGRERY